MADVNGAAFSFRNAALSIVTGTMDQAWSKFFLWLNCYAIRCRRLRGAGGAAASPAPRAVSGAAGNAPNREIEIVKSVGGFRDTKSIIRFSSIRVQA
jgi:hypothetical protein